MTFLKYTFLLAICCIGYFGHSQDCFLGIGGKDSLMIKKIFQLNEEQINEMKTQQEMLAAETKIIEGQIELLLAEHPQSKEEDLITMGTKYKELQSQLVKVSVEADKKLLKTFNAKQYERYLQLCKEAYRRPINITPKEYEMPETEEN